MLIKHIMDIHGEGMVPKLIIWHHLGLGDHIICNGLVHELTARAEQILLPCKTNNTKTVAHLYSDYPDILVADIGNLDYNGEASAIVNMSINNNLPLLRIGFTGQNDTPFDEQFYQQMGVDFEKRWTNFRMPIDKTNADLFFNSFIGHDEYALVHNTASIGTYELQINTNLPIYFVDKSLESMLDWRTVIENAKEIHCIDSSFIHLVDSLNLSANKLVYHDVGRGSIFKLKNEWNGIIYS